MSKKEDQKKLSDKRKKAGLKLVKLYLDEETLDLLTKFSSEVLKYPEPKTYSQNRLDTLSKVVTYCINDTIPEGKKITPKRYTIEENQLEKIIKYRKSQGDSHKTIASFLNQYEYPTRKQLRSKRLLSNQRWTEKEVDSLAND